MREAFDLVNDASEEVKKHLSAEVLETTVSEGKIRTVFQSTLNLPSI